MPTPIIVNVRAEHLILASDAFREQLLQPLFLGEGYVRPLIEQKALRKEVRCGMAAVIGPLLEQGGRQTTLVELVGCSESSHSRANNADAWLCHFSGSVI